MGFTAKPQQKGKAGGGVGGCGETALREEDRQGMGGGLENLSSSKRNIPQMSTGKRRKRCH